MIDYSRMIKCSLVEVQGLDVERQVRETRR